MARPGVILKAPVKGNIAHLATTRALIRIEAAGLRWNGIVMERQFDIVIERDEEGLYVASVPQLHGCHTQARSLDDLIDRVREAIELCLDVEGVPTNELEFIGIQRITVAA